MTRNQISERKDKENYEDDTGGETKVSKIGTGKDETLNLINKMCLNEIINNLEEREKKIIVLRYYREKTQSEVAKILGISQVQVSRIEKKVLPSDLASFTLSKSLDLAKSNGRNPSPSPLSPIR